MVTLTEASGIRVSSIAEWLTCEAMALESPKREGRLNAATYVGTLAHAELTGMKVETPARVSWDSTTPAVFHAHAQAEAIAKAAQQCLEFYGWRVLEQEVTVSGEDDIGHLDLLVYRADGKRAIIDLKTGRVGAGWLQVGGYLYLSDLEEAVAAGRANRGMRELHYGGILQVQRVKLSLDPMARLELRPAELLIDAWNRARDRVEDVMQGAIATRSPGFHCNRCRAVCAVRENEEENLHG